MPLTEPFAVPRRLIAVCIAVLLAAASIIAVPAAAHAATPGIVATLLLNGETYDGTDVVQEGDTITLQVQYNSEVTPGSTVEFDIGGNVSVSTSVPAGNSAISAISAIFQRGNTVSVTFADPWPSDVNQGVFELGFTIDEVESSGETPITWGIDGAEASVTVIVRNDDDSFENISESYSKSVTPDNLDSYVSVSDGQVVLDPSIADQLLTYTLALGSPEARDDFTIADQLPHGLSYVAGSASARITNWDAEGLNQTTSDFTAFDAVVDGDSFSWTGDVPGPSNLTITYQVQVADVVALQALLQTQYESLGGASGAFTIQLTNTASFGDVDRTASVRVRGTVAGSSTPTSPSLRQAFGKTADWSTQNVVTAEDGTLTPAADIVYTLRADLSQWDGSSDSFTLQRNVVISDTLPDQASWSSSDADFVTATGVTLTQAASCPDAASFAADAYVGQWCVDGQTLLINVGKDAATVASIKVKAQLTTVEGLSQETSTTIEDAVSYTMRNTASFTYANSGNPFTASRDVTVVVIPEGDGINDSSVFTKTGTAEETSVDVGETVTVTVDYTMSVAAGKGIDMANSKIVDYIDADIFDVTDPDAVSISGSYDSRALDAGDFTLSADEDGNLVIEMSDAGKAVAAARGADKAFQIYLSLTSTPFTAKETRTIANTATLFGVDGEPDYWSRTATDVTSYGDEAEVRKRVYDNATGEWVSSVDAQMDGSGNLVQDTFVYRIEFIPHGSYDNVAIIPVDDILPDAVDFLGFVTEADAATGANAQAGPVDIGDNLVASYDADTRTVSISQKDGTLLDAGGTPAAYVAVQVTDASSEIVNAIDESTATIVPRPSVSVGDYVWFDANRDGRQDADESGIPGVVLTLTGPDGGSVTDVNGNPVAEVTTDENGAYTFDDLPALDANQTYTVSIDQEASEAALSGYAPTVAGQGDRAGDSSTWVASSEAGDLTEDGDRDPTLDFGFVDKTYAIGDLVWIDADGDGVQGDGEEPLAGVTVDLLQDDVVVSTTTTGDDGRYVFDGLSAGTYQVRFTLSAEQQAVYELTSLDAGADDALDSDADTTSGLTRSFVLDDSNTALTTDYAYRSITATQGIDPTWDAGVVLIPVIPAGGAEDTTTVADVTDAAPAETATVDTALPVTGGTIDVGIIAVGVALLGAGLALVRFTRRRATR